MEDSKNIKEDYKRVKAISEIPEVEKEKKPLGVQVLFFLLMLIAGLVFSPPVIVLIVALAICGIIPACFYFVFSYLKERNHNLCKLKTNKNYCMSKYIPVKKKNEFI